MRFGVCCGFDDVSAVLKADYDYVELAASGLSDDPVLYTGLPTEATNVFFKGSIKLFGPDATPYLDVAKATVDRAAKIGVQTMVIGSGASRTSPPGIDLEWSEREFVLIAAVIGDYAKQYGITVAPESLCRAETNVGNDLGGFARALQQGGVAYTADSFHVLQEWNAGAPSEPYPSDEHWAEQIPFLPAHVHIADLPRRAVHSSDPMLQGFARRLKQLGYDGRVSLEYGRGSDFAAEIKAALADLKTLFA